MSAEQPALGSKYRTGSRMWSWWRNTRSRHDSDLDYLHLKFCLIRSVAIALVVVSPLIPIAAVNPAARWLCFAVAVPVCLNRFVYHALVSPFGTYEEKIKNKVSSYGYVFFFVLLAVQRNLGAPVAVVQACIVLITVTACVNFLSDLKEFAPLWAKSGDAFKEAQVIVPADQSASNSLLRPGAYLALHRVEASDPAGARRIKYEFKPVVSEPLMSFLASAAIGLGYNLVTAPFGDHSDRNSYAALTLWLGGTAVAFLLFPWQRAVAVKFNAELARGRDIDVPSPESLLGYSKSLLITNAKILFGGALIMWEIVALAWLTYPIPVSEETQLGVILTIAAFSAASLVTLLIGKDGRTFVWLLVRNVWQVVKRNAWVERVPAESSESVRILGDGGARAAAGDKDPAA